MGSMVSILMPVYHGEAFIEIALDSVLNQTYRNFELIIINDCAIDSSVQILKKKLSGTDIHWKLLEHSVNKGIAYSYNEALTIATGQYISLLDEDDYYDPEKLLRQTSFLDSHPEYIAVSGKTAFVDKEGNDIHTDRFPYLTTNEIKAKLLFENCFCNGEVMFRKAVLEDYNIRYKEYGFGLDDMGFWMQLSKFGDFFMLKDVVYYHRIHEANMTTFYRNCCSKERGEVYKMILAESLARTSLDLSVKAIEILSEILTEDKKRMQLNTEESKRILPVRDEVISKAENLGIGYAEQIKQYFEKKCQDIN